MSGLSVAGIASGIDSDSIIAQMVSFETRSNAQLQRRIATEEAERVLFQDISTRLQELKGATNVFTSQNLFNSLSTSSSAPDLVSVSATDKAPRGTQRVRVMQLATSHRIGGTGVDDPIATPLLQGGFAKTSYTNAALKNIAAGSRDLTATSSYDFETNVSINGTYTGDENLNMVVKLAEDQTFTNGTESVDLKISTDGGSTFTTVTATAAGGSLSATVGDFTVTFDNLTGETLKKNDELSFRARATSVLEFSVGADGERKSVEIDSDTTLSELVRAINDDSSLGIRADILNDGSATNPYRLILTSETEGRTGSINILHNDSVIDLDGLNVEDAVLDSVSYGGDITFNSADYLGGLNNNSVVIEVMEAGAVGAAKFRISTDGGLNFYDNSGAGFTLDASTNLATLQESGVDIFEAGTFNADTFNVNFTNVGTFNVGDRVTMDFFDSEIETAQDALINVNGINLVKSSNVVDDVFEGLTLTLKDADPTKTINVGVTEKAGDIGAALGGFVQAYNSIMSVLHAQSKYNPDEDDSAPLLMGDSTVRQLQSSLQRYVTGRIGILGSDTMSSLADVGITTDSKTGQLNFNPTKLTQALNEDSNAVRRLLSRFGDVVDGSNVSFVSSTSTTKPGMYKVEVTQARTRAELVAGSVAQTVAANEELILRVNKDANGTGDVTSMVVTLAAGTTPQGQVQAIQDMLDSRDLNVSVALESGKIVIRHNEYGSDFALDVISDQAAGANSGFGSTKIENQGTDLKGKINGVEATASDDLLIGKSGFAFAGLSVRITDGFVGSAGTIRVNDGLGSSFTKLLDSFIGGQGILDTRINSFDSAISRLQSQISRVNERASLLEDRLRKQFTNLEVTLGRLNATGDYLTAQLKALPGVKKD